MSAKVIDFQDYKKAQSEDSGSEYELLKELMTALFGPMEEDDSQESFWEQAAPATT